MQKELLDEVLAELTKVVDLPVQVKQHEQLIKHLESHINYLINNDFNQLVSLLYRLDISEAKLRQLADQREVPAATIITRMIVERQVEKIAARKTFKKDDNIPEDERW